MAKSMTDLPCHLSQKPDPRSNGLIGRKQPETLRHKIADKGGSSSDCTHLSSPTGIECGSDKIATPALYSCIRWLRGRSRRLRRIQRPPFLREHSRWNRFTVHRAS
ncbi:uncharacterized protein [Linepithema humile]|uniref:uncharacterized protein isoform X2 n=1 Tax=Linepithema humile TaxID=83485 RepID=UPI00351F1B0C